MLDWETARQQEAVGLLGVDLIHAAFHETYDPITIISSQLDGLTNQQIEGGMIKSSGPADGETVTPTELLYKKAVLL